MTIKWNLPKMMHLAGIFSCGDLRKLLREQANYDISAPAVFRLVKGLPKECKLTTMNALCQVLKCKPSDIIIYEPPTVANECVQPLILPPSFTVPGKSSQKKEKKGLDIDSPPI